MSTAIPRPPPIEESTLRPPGAPGSVPGRRKPTEEDASRRRLDSGESAKTATSESSARLNAIMDRRGTNEKTASPSIGALPKPRWSARKQPVLSSGNAVSNGNLDVDTRVSESRLGVPEVSGPVKTSLSIPSMASTISGNVDTDGITQRVSAVSAFSNQRGLTESMRPEFDGGSSRGTHGASTSWGVTRGSSLNDKTRASASSMLSVVTVTKTASLKSTQLASSAGGSSSSSSRCHPCLAAVRRWAVPHCRALNKNKFWQLLMLLALLSALFLPDLWILIDRPDNTELDVILTCVLALFISELAVQSIGMMRTYLGSFFFWMDLLGAFSLLLDLTYLPFQLAKSDGESMSENVMVLRMARIAKLGARAGRFTKLVKLLRFLPGIRDSGVGRLGTAKMIASRLTTLLSTRVSCLIIIMVVLMPLFSLWTYPEQDWSMTAWLEILEEFSSQEGSQFKGQLDQFKIFYGDLGYYPYKLTYTSRELLSNTTALELPWFDPRGPPKRATNMVRFSTHRFICDFNFKQPNQLTSLMNILLMVFIMMLMVGFSLVLSNSVSAIVLKPLEKILLQVRNLANKIFQSVTTMATNLEEGDGEDGEDSVDSEADPANAGFGYEALLLEKVMQKVAALSDLTINKTGIDAETMAGMNEGDRAVMIGYGGGGQQEHASASKDSPDHTLQESETDEGSRAELFAAQKSMIEGAGLSLDLLNTWNINPLELDRARNRAAVTYFLGPHNHGVSFDPVAMGHFLEAAEAGYIKSVQYHNWFHAVDVTHCVYRLLKICNTESFFSTHERYALLVSATCHDVGHPGLNNIFLVEASHELALLYNDKSPLENMHCSRLFGFVSMPKCNIFASLTSHQFQEVRKCCIETILHTDNAHHFAMIKEVQMLYEMNSDIFSIRPAGKQEEVFPGKELGEFLRSHDSRQLLAKFLLHMADISNCTKPFRVCRLWSQKILEEFFSQGDKELEVGLPVQALNDREKVNKPLSQINFVEFLISPLIFAGVRVLPPTRHMAKQMVLNTKSWHKIWVEETNPGETERQGIQERVGKLERRYEESRSDGNS